MNLLKPLFVLLSLTCSLSTAQLHEIGFFGGGSNFIGDVGTTKYVYPNSVAYGLFYRYNLNTRISLRAGINASILRASDLRTRDLNRFRRQYQFENFIKEGIVGVEVNYVDFDLLNVRRQFTPYLFFGLGYFEHQLFYFIDNAPNIPQKNNYGKKGNFVLPINVGVKSNITKRMSLGIELGVRYTLTDNIDGSNPINEFSELDELKFGNLGNNDWYIFTGITISFTFGKLPCYCLD